MCVVCWFFVMVCNWLGVFVDVGFKVYFKIDFICYVNGYYWYDLEVWIKVNFF